MKTFFAIFCSLLLTMGAQAADKVKVTVSNPLDFARGNELVELDKSAIDKKLDKAGNVIVTDADGVEIPSQVTYDGKLIFSVGVSAKGKSVYYVQPGTPKTYESKVFGRQYPERVDDIAWENDRVAYRCYGPALQKSGERAWGYDIWTKRTDKLVVDERYALELDPEIAQACRKLRKMGQEELAQEVYYAVSYHVDHGTGMDCYKVGPTLGAGTTAILENGGRDIRYPHCYTRYEILDRGPIRFTVKLVYAPETIEGQQVVETRIISLDAGSQLNKAVITYEGLSKPMPIATGIIVHNENPSAYVLSEKGCYMGYEDLGDPNQYKERWRAKLNKDFGQIYVGVVYAGKTDKMEYREGKDLPGACGHILGITDYNKGAYTYWFGSGWSRNPNTSFHSLADWEGYLSKFSQQVQAPLKVKF